VRRWRMRIERCWWWRVERSRARDGSSTSIPTTFVQSRFLGFCLYNVLRLGPVSAHQTWAYFHYVTPSLEFKEIGATCLLCFHGQKHTLTQRKTYIFRASPFLSFVHHTTRRSSRCTFTVHAIRRSRLLLALVNVRIFRERSSDNKREARCGFDINLFLN
jgi:hypothetical protein